MMMVWYLILGIVLGAATVIGVLSYVAARFFKGLGKDIEHPGDFTA